MTPLFSLTDQAMINFRHPELRCFFFLHHLRISQTKKEMLSKLHKPQQLLNVYTIFPSCQYWLDFESFREMMKGIHSGKLFHFFINACREKTARQILFWIWCKIWQPQAMGGIVLQKDHYTATGLDTEGRLHTSSTPLFYVNNTYCTTLNRKWIDRYWRSSWAMASQRVVICQ